MADETGTTGDTLTDIHASVGDLLSGAEVEFDDDALDAELDAKAETEPDSEPEPVEPDDDGELDAIGLIEGDEAEKHAEPVAAPFTYTVDGQEKTYPGGQIVDGRAVFAPEQVKDLQYAIQRREYLETQNSALYDKVRQFDAVSVPDRATGAEHKGFAAVEHLVVENARQHAALQLMADVIENPEKLIPLAIAVQSGDMSGLSALTDRLRLLAENATYKTQSQFSQRIAEAKSSEAQTEDRAAVTPNAITSAVEQWSQKYPDLTAADKQHAIQHLTKIGSVVVRPATPDEAKTATANGTPVKPGQLIIDHPVVDAYLSDRAELRKELSRSTTAASTAAKENAARLAAAQRGTRRTTTPTKAKPRATVPAATDETWAQQRARMMNGEFAVSDDE